MKKTKLITAVTASVAAAALLTVAASADSYNGYLAFQSAAYSFRNPFDDANFGRDTDYFKSVIVWGNNDPEKFPEYEDNFDYDKSGYVIPATFTDAVIDGDGTYTVAIDDYDWSLDGGSGFNTLLINTDIPLDTGATITSATITVDGAVQATVENPMQNPDTKDNIQVLFANVWNTTLEQYAGAYPTKSLSIEFTVSNLGAATEAAETVADEAAPAEETAATEAAVDTEANSAAAEDKASSPETGVEGVAAVAAAALIAVGGIAVAKRRK